MLLGTAGTQGPWYSLGAKRKEEESLAVCWLWFGVGLAKGLEALAKCLRGYLWQLRHENVVCDLVK